MIVRLTPDGVDGVASVVVVAAAVVVGAAVVAVVAGAAVVSEPDTTVVVGALVVLDATVVVLASVVVEVATVIVVVAPVVVSVVDGEYKLVDTCCGSEYSLTLEGAVLKGPSRTPLVRYQTIYFESTNQLRVFNQ